MYAPSIAPNTAWIHLAIAVSVAICAGCGASRSGSSATTPASPTAQSGVPAAATDIPNLVRQTEPSVVTVLTDNGLGSGTVYKTDGTIITDAHVVAGAHQITVAFADGQQMTAKVRATDNVSDVAVLQADRSGLTPATLERSLPDVGALAVVIGSPLGFEATVTSGIISGLHRQIPGSESASAPLVDLVQTDAPISPGNSGGALIDGRGHVVGVCEAYIPPSAGAVALGFATAAAAVVDVADQLLATGTAHHAYLGILPRTLTPQIAEQLKVNRTAGVVVMAVGTPSPVADAGIKPGDVITAFNGRGTPTADSFIAALLATKPGDKIELTTRNAATRPNRFRSPSQTAPARKRHVR